MTFKEIQKAYEINQLRNDIQEIQNFLSDYIVPYTNGEKIKYFVDKRGEIEWKTPPKNMLFPFPKK